MKMKKIISLCLVGAMALTLLVGCGKKKESTSEKKTLVMATNAEFPPYEYYEGKKIVGIDAEIAAGIAKEMGMKLKIEDMAFDSIIASVNSGKADFGAAGMTITEDRKQSVDFTQTYAKSTQVIIVKKDSKVTKPDDLKGKKVGVQLGTTGDLYAGDIKDATIERYNKGFEAVQSLIQGKVDAVIIDQQPAKEFVKDASSNLKILDEAFTNEEYAMAVKKGNKDLLDKMNAALTKMKNDGSLDKIINKYIK
ncbi:MAG: basic amino acid ABC transporter substrate-binding protein [Lachnospiraceae bacterium]|jgi:polar amino acid transport system substrate-binding protein|nr:basic amino acid ABC transporter substrate-binding protein [Lachnospiraceae bacterium]